ncbi:MAG TPA: hypothetical protein VGE85_04315 [Terracidiphilus sp.]|jgi:hypothetical protein
MKSPEVYSLLKIELAPWFKSEGFKRAKGLLSWTRPHGDAHIVVWCQVSQYGWDPYAGSQFIVEFQRSSEPVIGYGYKNAHRERIALLLSPEEREEVRRIQNSVIASLQHPPANHPILHFTQEVTDIYVKQFKAVSEPYPERNDIWFRYASPEHITQWAHFIIGRLPKCVAIAESWSNLSMPANVF